MKFLYKVLILNIILLCTMAIGLEAQTVIRGKVTDGTTKEALAFASVLVKGSTVGAVTDLDGNFEISIRQDLPLTLQVS